jgi:hypothetical protein
MTVKRHSLPNRDVRVTSVRPSISDMTLQRRERRNGPTGDIAKRACCRYQSLVLYLLVQRG